MPSDDLPKASKQTPSSSKTKASTGGGSKPSGGNQRLVSRSNYMSMQEDDLVGPYSDPQRKNTTSTTTRTNEAALNKRSASIASVQGPPLPPPRTPGQNSGGRTAPAVGQASNSRRAPPPPPLSLRSSSTLKSTTAASNSQTNQHNTAVDNNSGTKQRTAISGRKNMKETGGKVQQGDSKRRLAGAEDQLDNADETGSDRIIVADFANYDSQSSLASAATNATIGGGQLDSTAGENFGSGSRLPDDLMLVNNTDDDGRTSGGRKLLTKNLMWAVFASTVGSSFQHGYNGGVVNAPEKLIGEFINETYHMRHGQYATENQIDFIISIIVAIFCIGGCLGALLTAFVADRIGRKEGLMYNNLLVLLASPLMASSRSMASYELLILGRLLIGINAGLNAGLAPLYLNEIAPVELRGALGTIYQLVITISILLSNIFGLPSLLGDHDSWPILFALPIIPAAFMLAVLPHLCESPKHLLLNHGKELQAQQALAWLRETGDVQEEMDELRSERELQALMNNRTISLGDMLSETSLRRPLTIAIVIMLSQQFSGINAVLFFSTSIFRDAGLSEHAAVQATLGMSMVNVAMTLVSLFLVDRAGRRTLHMTGLMGMAATCLVLALCLNTKSAGHSMDGEDFAPISSSLAVVAVYVFIAMFASGPGAIPWFLVAELFPSNARPLASSIAVAVNWLANFTVSLCFLPLSNLLHGFTFVLFAILLVMFYLFTYYKVPETKGATAEEISALFRTSR